MPTLPAEPDCPNCQIPLAIPHQPITGEIDCPVCTLALYYARLPANCEAIIYLIKQGMLPVEEWGSVQQCLAASDSISTVEAMMILDEYREA